MSESGRYVKLPAMCGVTIIAVPVLDAAGTIPRTIASVGISSQLDRATALALAHDMQEAARLVGAPHVSQPTRSQRHFRVLARPL